MSDMVHGSRLMDHIVAHGTLSIRHCSVLVNRVMDHVYWLFDMISSTTDHGSRISYLLIDHNAL